MSLLDSFMKILCLWLLCSRISVVRVPSPCLLRHTEISLRHSLSVRTTSLCACQMWWCHTHPLLDCQLFVHENSGCSQTLSVTSFSMGLLLISTSPCTLWPGLSWMACLLCNKIIDALHMSTVPESYISFHKKNNYLLRSFTAALRNIIWFNRMVINCKFLILFTCTVICICLFKLIFPVPLNATQITEIFEYR